jgi:hypothetical protein
MTECTLWGLRVLQAPLVAEGPSGVAIKTCLHVSDGEAGVLRRVRGVPRDAGVGGSGVPVLGRVVAWQGHVGGQETRCGWRVVLPLGWRHHQGQ